MFNIQYSKYVSYTADQMFFLVNDIKSYSEFIPGCILSRVIKQYATESIAEITVSVSGINKSLVTRNMVVKNKVIKMYLVSGPFRSLFGYWNFIYIDKKSSIVKFYLEYDIIITFINASFFYFINNITEDLLTIFINRAKTIYNIKY